MHVLTSSLPSHMEIRYIESAIHKFTKDVSLGEDVIVSVINFYVGDMILFI